MDKKLKSNRLSGIGEYYFSTKLREIEKLNAEGKNILNLGIGSPDLSPPISVKDALVKGLDEAEFHQYQSYKGIPELRTTFSNWYQKYFGVLLDPESEVLPLIGSKEGIIHVSMALLSEGDQVLVPNPGYPAYGAAATLAGAEKIHYTLKEENQYLPDLTALEKINLEKVKIMWVNYPHMPTGSEGSDELFDQLIAFSRKHQIVVVNDNPYGFILTSERRSLLKGGQKDDLLLELNSLSKSHNMPGWRVGVLVGNPDLIQTTLNFKSNVDSGQFKPVMRAAIAALRVEDSWYNDLNDLYNERKVLVSEIVNLLGGKTRENEVGMFVWMHIPQAFTNGQSYTDHLLDKYGIFVPPGTVFGSEGEKYVRFSLCSPKQIWEQVIDRIKAVSALN